jgi:hypothetical protein
MWKTSFNITKYEATTIKIILGLEVGDRFSEILKIVFKQGHVMD